MSTDKKETKEIKKEVKSVNSGLREKLILQIASGAMVSNDHIEKAAEKVIKLADHIIRKLEQGV